MSTSITLDQTDTTGVIFAGGSHFGGWAFYLKDGRPVALEAASNLPRDKFKVEAPEALQAGKSTVTYQFKSDGGPNAGGEMTIFVNEEKVASGRIGKSIVVLAGLGETWDVGQDTGVPVSREYDPGEFPGDIDFVRITLEPMTAGRRPAPGQAGKNTGPQTDPQPQSAP